MLFFMHMNASDGTLSIRVGQRGTPGFIAKTYSGDKGENWLTEKIDVIYQIDTVVSKSITCFLPDKVFKGNRFY